VRGEPLVIVGKKRALVESGKGCVLIEFDVVLIQMMVIFHNQVVEFIGGRGEGVGFSKRRFEGIHEVVPDTSILK